MSQSDFLSWNVVQHSFTKNQQLGVWSVYVALKYRLPGFEHMS